MTLWVFDCVWLLDSWALLNQTSPMLLKATHLIAFDLGLLEQSINFLRLINFHLFAQSLEANATSVLVAREHLRPWEMRSRQNYFR
jgi:hypothetical protein